MPATGGGHRQKRRPHHHRSGGHGSRPASGSSHRHHNSSSRTGAAATPGGQQPDAHTLHRRVSFAAGGQSSAGGGAQHSAPDQRGALNRRASFDPRMGARAHHSSRPPADDNAAWPKLVARAQNLEEALASERASRRLLLARTATEKAAMLAQVAKAQEERDGMEHLWREGKQHLQSRTSEWEAERSMLYQELGRLRAQLRAAGIAPLPPSAPPANLASALRDQPSISDMISDVPAVGALAPKAHRATQQHAATRAEEAAAPTGGEACGTSGDSLRSHTSSSYSRAGAPEAAPAAQALDLEEHAAKLGAGALSSAKLAAAVVARSASSADSTGGGVRWQSRDL